MTERFSMTPRERVLAAIQHRESDRIPRFEIWIDALLPGLELDDPSDVYVALGQDCIMMPTLRPPQSNAWQNGIDEWGRVWENGMYIGGIVDTDDDLHQYSTPIDYVEHHFDDAEVAAVRTRHPDHCLIYGTHIGPFTAGFMAMGFERFFTRLMDDPIFVRRLLEDRTAWCIAMYQKAVSLGAEVLVLGDDAGSTGGPLISPILWRERVLPYHRRIVDALDVPVIWHSDGNIERLLPMAIEAGFVGVHGLEPAAGIDLGAIKRDFGNDLVLVGNIDVGVLCDTDLDAVRREVDRCLEHGAPGGGYMIATCNSIFTGMNVEIVAEMFRYEEKCGFYTAPPKSPS
jgi:uroporphyrinogen decarboxylase